jgi:hypothetical protein
LIGLLPIKPKKSNILGVGDNDMTEQAKLAMTEVVRRILQPLKQFSNPFGTGRPVEMYCADGYVRSCWPVLASWIADHPEHCNLQGNKSNVCPTCTVDRHHTGEYGTEAPLRDSEEHRYFFQEYIRGKVNKHAIASPRAQAWFNTRNTVPQTTSLITAKVAAAAWFEATSTRTDENVFWDTPFVKPYDLPRPDLLHVMLLGIFKTVMIWIEGFLKKHERLAVFDALWAKTPPYTDGEFVKPTKGYREVVQWQGKEMRNLARILLTTLVAALVNPTPRQTPEFDKAIRCVRALVQFHQMTEYHSHTDATVEYLEHYLSEFHQYLPVFLEYRTTVKIKAAITTIKTMFKNRIDEALKEAKKQGRSPSTQEQIKEQLLLEQADEIDAVVQEQANFSFPKMHLLNHFARSIKRFGNLKQYSTEFSESAHRNVIKDAYNHSNKQIDIMDQIMAANDRINIFAMRELNLKRMAADGMYSDQTIRILGLHNREQLRKVQQNMRKSGQDLSVGLIPTHHEEFGTRPAFPRRILKNFSPTYFLSDVKILEMGPKTLVQILGPFYRDSLGIPVVDLDIQHEYILRLAKELKVPVPLHQDLTHSLGYTMHTLRCSGSEGYRNGPPRNDNCWITVDKNEERWKNKHINGLVLCRVIALIKVWRIASDVPRVHAIVRDFQLRSRGNVLQKAHRLTRWKYDTEVVPWATRLGAIYGGAHCVLDGTIPGDIFYANPHIDLATWNVLQTEV